MVKLATPKLNMVQRLQEKKVRELKASRKGGSRVYQDDKLLGKDGYPFDKGEYLGSCNRSACLRPSAIWYNHSTRKYYCRECAHLLNHDTFNHRDALRMYGHLLCTEGRYDDTWDYRYQKPVCEVVKLSQASETAMRWSLEKKFFEDFMSIFKEPDGRYKHLRLGQAFYNHFNLDKIDERLDAGALYQKDGREAEALIYTMFRIHETDTAKDKQNDQ